LTHQGAIQNPNNIRAAMPSPTMKAVFAFMVVTSRESSKFQGETPVGQGFEPGLHQISSSNILEQAYSADVQFAGSKNQRRGTVAP
jgi:hypothetical protein